MKSNLFVITFFNTYILNHVNLKRLNDYFEPAIAGVGNIRPVGQIWPAKQKFLAAL